MIQNHDMSYRCPDFFQITMFGATVRIRSGDRWMDELDDKHHPDRTHVFDDDRDRDDKIRFALFAARRDRSAFLLGCEVMGVRPPNRDVTIKLQGQQ